MDSERNRNALTLRGLVKVTSVRGALLLAALLLTLSVWAAETSEWFLAGQEGKCIPLSALAKRGAEFQESVSGGGKDACGGP